jgi:hypothetical protein
MNELTHTDLCILWIRFNGQNPTVNQIMKTKKVLDFQTLFNMLKERNIIKLTLNN